MSTNLADLSGPKVGLKFRSGQVAVLPCTFPAGISAWSGFKLEVKPSSTGPTIKAAVDITNLAGASRQVVFTFTAAQTRLMRNGAAFAFWGTDANGNPEPLGSGHLLLEPEIKDVP